MMRKCHLNTCPVGIATQDPELIKKFDGQARARHQLFLLRRRGSARVHGEDGLAHLRRDDRAHRHARHASRHRALEGARPRLLAALLPPAGRSRRRDPPVRDAGPRPRRRRSTTSSSPRRPPRSTRSKPVQIESRIYNRNRTVGAMLSGEVARRYGHAGLPDDTIHVNFKGTAGQSFGGWLAHGDHLRARGRRQRLRRQGPVGRAARDLSAAGRARSSPRRTSSSATP